MIPRAQPLASTADPGFTGPADSRPDPRTPIPGIFDPDVQEWAMAAGWSQALVQWDEATCRAHEDALFATAEAIKQRNAKEARKKRRERNAERERTVALVDAIESRERRGVVGLTPDEAKRVEREMARRERRRAMLADPAEQARRWTAVWDAVARNVRREMRRVGTVDEAKVKFLVEERLEQRRAREGVEVWEKWERDASDLAALIGAEYRAGTRQMVREGLKFGFRGGYVTVGGREREAVTEVGLRSSTSHNIRLWVQRTPRCPRVGLTKSECERAGSKLLGLWEAYTEFNRLMWSMFRIDLDRNFASWEELRLAIRGLGLPCMPHLVIADVDPETGEVVRPHVIFHLPRGSEVWNDPTRSDCRRAPRDLFRAVHRALVNAFLPLGADPGCLSNPHHGKSATSPYWVVEARWEESTYPTLTEWAEARDSEGGRLLELGVTPEVLHRRAASVAAERFEHDPDAALRASRKRADARSNEIFTSMRGHAWKVLLPSWRACQDARYVLGIVDRTYLATSLQDALETHGRTISGDERRIVATARLVSSYVAAQWDPKRVDRAIGKARGRDLHAIDAGMDLRTRQGVGGRCTAEARSDAYRLRVHTALQEYLARGENPSDEALVRDLGMVLKTVRKHRKSFLGTVDAGPMIERSARVDMGSTDLSEAAEDDPETSDGDPSCEGEGVIVSGRGEDARFLSIHRRSSGFPAPAGDVDSAPVAGSGGVRIDLPDPPDPPWPPPPPAHPSSSASTSVASPEPLGARGTPSPPRSASWAVATRPRVPSRPGSPTSSSSSTPTSSSSSATTPEAEAERLARLSARRPITDAEFAALFG